jgi:hypothetical protein
MKRLLIIMSLHNLRIRKLSPLYPDIRVKTIIKSPPKALAFNFETSSKKKLVNNHFARLISRNSPKPDLNCANRLVENTRFFEINKQKVLQQTSQNNIASRRVVTPVIGRHVIEKTLLRTDKSIDSDDDDCVFHSIYTTIKKRTYEKK